MEKATDSQQKASREVEDNLSDEMKKLILTLPREYYTVDGIPLYQYNGVWCRTALLAGMIGSQRLFQAQDSDIILAVFPKSGTLWISSSPCGISCQKLLTTKKKEPLSLEEAFEKVCHGIQIFGPSWEHILGYWKTSLNNPEKILFLKYEDVKDDILFYVKKLASFLGCPFSDDEENQGVTKEVVKLCSFESMKNLEVNKMKTSNYFPLSCHFFRKGEVGDWTNYLSPSMSERLNSLIKEKFSGSSLTFRMS